MCWLRGRASPASSRQSDTRSNLQLHISASCTEMPSHLPQRNLYIPLVSNCSSSPLSAQH